MSTQTDYIRNLIAENKVEEALELTKSLNNSDEVIQLLSRWQEIKRREASFLIDFDSANVEISRIRAAILQYVGSADFSRTASSVNLGATILRTADDHYFESRFVEAIIEYRQIINLGMESEDVWYRLCYSYFQQKAYKEVLFICKGAIQSFPEDNRFYNIQGSVYRKYNMSDQALNSFEKALRIKPENEMCFNNVYSIYFYRNQFELLKAFCDNYIGAYPNKSHYYYKRAKFFQKKGDLDEALNDYNLAIKLNSDHADYYYDRGTLHSKRGDVNAALADLDVSYGKVPNLDCLMMKAAIYHDQGNMPAANATYTQVIDQDPLNYGNYYYRADTWYKIGNYQKALDDITLAKRSLKYVDDILQLEANIRSNFA
jgi:tetratricopeptide (TPR) repeat protein